MSGLSRSSHRRRPSNAEAEESGSAPLIEEPAQRKKCTRASPSFLLLQRRHPSAHRQPDRHAPRLPRRPPPPQPPRLLRPRPAVAAAQVGAGALQAHHEHHDDPRQLPAVGHRRAPKNMTRAPCARRRRLRRRVAPQVPRLEYGRAVRRHVRPRKWLRRGRHRRPDDCVLLEGVRPPTRRASCGRLQSATRRCAPRRVVRYPRRAKEDEAAARYFVHGWHEALDLDDHIAGAVVHVDGRSSDVGVYARRDAPNVFTGRAQRRCRRLRRAPRRPRRGTATAVAARCSAPTCCTPPTTASTERREERRSASSMVARGAPSRATQLADPELRRWSPCAATRHPGAEQAPELDELPDAYVFTREAVRAAGWSMLCAPTASSTRRRRSARRVSPPSNAAAAASARCAAPCMIQARLKSHSTFA